MTAIGEIISNKGEEKRRQAVSEEISKKLVGMNRHQRRAYGKMLGAKIPTVNIPFRRKSA